MKLTKLLLASALTSSALFAGGDIATAEEITTAPVVEENELQQRIVLYGWLPTLDGTMTFQVPGEPDESVETNHIDNLDAVIMGSYSLRKGDWSFLADLIYLKVSGDVPGKYNPLANYDIELTTKIFGFYGGYNILQENQLDLNFIAGLRYFGLGVDVKRSRGALFDGLISPSLDSYDAVIGVNGQYNIDANWYVPYQFDIGTGDSDLTWQANLSIAYRFGWGDVIGTYRYIHYDQDGTGLTEDFTLYGPKIGVVFNF